MTLIEGMRNLQTVLGLGVLLLGGRTAPRRTVPAPESET